MEKVFLNNKNELSKNGIYAVNFFTLGVPHTVVVDDYLPVLWQNEKWRSMGANHGRDGSIWG